MKKLIILALFLFACLPVIGQEESSEPVHFNEGKLLFTDLINGSVILGYERALGKHLSVSLMAGYKSKDGLLKLSGIDTDQFKTDDLTYSGLRVIPEVRYYLNEHSKGMLTGFYFGGYVTFMRYKSDFKGTYINENGSFPFFYEAKINTSSVGLMIGYKLPVSKHFNIDFLIAGPGAGTYRFKLKEITPAPPEFWFDLNEALELYSIADLINADFDFTPNKNSDDLVLPSFRYGIILGYSF
jgi:hypothetical protein